MLDTILTYLTEQDPARAARYSAAFAKLDMRPVAEQWKNFPLTKMLAGSFTPLVYAHSIAPDPRLLRLQMNDVEEFDTLVFFNGQFVAEISSLPDGVSVMFEPKQESKEYAHVGELISTFLSDPTLIRIDNGYKATKPLRILKFFQAIAAPLFIPNSITIAIEPGLRVELLEEIQVLGDLQIVDAGISDYKLYDNASLNLTYTFPASDLYSALSTSSAHLHPHTAFQMCMVGAGGETIRHDATIHLEEDAESHIFAAFHPHHNEVRNLHTKIVHSGAQSRSTQIVRSVPFDKSKTTFDAMINVKQDAQKVDASFYGKTLMMSDDAKSFVIPKLEIYADDVKCAHGASIGHIIPEHMEYMRARGIGEMRARSLLALAFLREIYDKIPNAMVKERMIRDLEKSFYLA